MKLQLLNFLTIVILLFVSCNGEKKKEPQKAEQPENEGFQPKEKYFFQEAGITVYEIDDLTEFPGATLSIKSPEPGTVLEPGANDFSFRVENYSLGNQTKDTLAKLCANSKKGQHIHFIVNNRPYEAYYNVEFSSELEEGNNTILAFLSRSYHKSIKQKEAFTLVQYPTAEDAEEIDLDAEHLFYSRPKGKYIGDETEYLLLDFYLVNTDLSPDGNKVKVSINGSTEFTLDKWAPYLIKGLPVGEHTFRIQLLDKDDNPVPGPFNDSGERTIVLEELPIGDKV